MRVQEEQTPHASWSFGMRQFSARATSSAKRFLPMPSSPTNSSAPGSLSATSIRFNAALTRSFPVSSLNIIHREMAAALQKRNDDLFHAFLRVLDWTTRAHAGTRERDHHSVSAKLRPSRDELCLVN